MWREILKILDFGVEVNNALVYYRCNTLDTIKSKSIVFTGYLHCPGIIGYGMYRKSIVLLWIRQGFVSQSWNKICDIPAAYLNRSMLLACPGIKNYNWYIYSNKKTLTNRAICAGHLSINILVCGYKVSPLSTHHGYRGWFELSWTYLKKIRD